MNILKTRLNLRRGVSKNWETLAYPWILKFQKSWDKNVDLSSAWWGSRNWKPEASSVFRSKVMTMFSFGRVSSRTFRFHRFTHLFDGTASVVIVWASKWRYPPTCQTLDTNIYRNFGGGTIFFKKFFWNCEKSLSLLNWPKSRKIDNFDHSIKLAPKMNVIF